MTFVLSIIASPPPDFRLPADTISDGNRAISDLLDMMNRAAADSAPGDYQKQVAQAAYVRDIAVTLSDLKTQKRNPDIIQIIGHGSAGRLELSSYWTLIDRDPQHGYGSLDSNPDSYGMLLEVVPQSAKVFLLGCNVGSMSPGGYVASGRALLFDLEDMTGADFYAADGLVHPQLFRDSFLYSGSLVTSAGKPANPAALALRQLGIGPPDPGNIEAPKLTRLVSAPALGFRSALAPIEVPSIFNEYTLAKTQPTRLLAMAELVFEATNYNRVEAICCLQYLRAETKDGQTVYFSSPAESVNGHSGPDRDPRLYTEAMMESLRRGAIPAGVAGSQSTALT